MDESLYDEFGNYIGPDLSDDSDSDASPRGGGGSPGFSANPSAASDGDGASAADEPEDEIDGGVSSIVLHEDKKHYASAEELYAPGTETLVEEEDAQGLEVPLVARERVVKLEADAGSRAGGVPQPLASPTYLASLLHAPSRCRYAVVLGALHSGKTSLVDLLVRASHEGAIVGKRDEGERAAADGDGDGDEGERPVPPARAQTWNPYADPDSPQRWTDSREDERARRISVKATAVTLAVGGSRGAARLLGLIDAPGHADFGDEAAAAARLVDGALIVVDVVEGATLGTELAVRAAARERLPPVLVINKIDRLALELRLPPADAHHKISAVLRAVRALVARFYAPEGVDGDAAGSLAGSDRLVLDPRRGNVLFASAKFGWCFSLESFAEAFAAARPGEDVDAARLAPRLWGDVWLDDSRAALTTDRTRAQRLSLARSFARLVLEPVYKLHVAALSDDPELLGETCEDWGIELPRGAADADPKPLLAALTARALGGAACISDALARHVPDARAGAARLVRRAYPGGSAGAGAAATLRAASPAGPPLAVATAQVPRADASAFDLLARVVSGTFGEGDEVRVLGEAYGPEDDEDSSLGVVEGAWLPLVRARAPGIRVPAGGWVLLGGVEAGVAKGATVVGRAVDLSEDAGEGRPGPGRGGPSREDGAPAPAPPALTPSTPLPSLRAFPAPTPACSRSVVRVAVEPLVPGDLPRLVEGLRRATRSYPGLATRVEESGEHSLLAPGELYLDSVLRDLRESYASVEVRVADPSVAFREGVSEGSSLRCHARSANGKFKITMVAEPMEEGLCAELESGELFAKVAAEAAGRGGTAHAPLPSGGAQALPRRALAEVLQRDHGWDLMAARRVWAFGPEASGPNALVDDTLGDEVKPKLLAAVRAAAAQGFAWGAREGPLCDEPMRGVRFRVVGAEVPVEPGARGAGQVIPAARRAAYSSFLLASPRLLEPVLRVEIDAPADALPAVYAVLGKRRGHVVGDSAVPGTPLFRVHALLPAIESFGFETDVRVHSQGAAFPQSVFERWEPVPGDPLDRSVALRPLEPAPPHALARDFCVKTRRRKGMSADVSIAQFFDDPMLKELGEADDDLARLL